MRGSCVRKLDLSVSIIDDDYKLDRNLKRISKSLNLDEYELIRLSVEHRAL